MGFFSKPGREDNNVLATGRYVRQADGTLKLVIGEAREQFPGVVEHVEENLGMKLSHRRGGRTTITRE